MEKTVTIKELLDVINLFRVEEELEDYTIEELRGNIIDDELEDYIIEEESIDFYQCIGLLAYQPHYVRLLCTRELKKETHYTVSEYSKLNNLELEYGEVIIISKYCQKISDAENKIVKSKINKNNKTVKMFDVFVLKKAMKL